MANTKSAKKRVLQTERNRERNRAIRSALRTEVKRFRVAVKAGDADAAAKLLRQAQSAIDRTAKKGVIPERTASRYKSRLALAHDKLTAAQQA